MTTLFKQVLNIYQVTHLIFIVKLRVEINLVGNCCHVRLTLQVTVGVLINIMNIIHVFYNERDTRQCTLLAANNVLRTRQTLACRAQVLYIVPTKGFDSAVGAFRTACTVIKRLLEWYQQVLPWAVPVVNSAVCIHALDVLNKTKVRLGASRRHTRHTIHDGV